MPGPIGSDAGPIIDSMQAEALSHSVELESNMTSLTRTTSGASSRSQPLGKNCSTKDQTQNLKFGAAASEGHAEVVAYLIENGADAPNQTRHEALKLVNLVLKNLRESPDDPRVRRPYAHCQCTLHL